MHPRLLLAALLLSSVIPAGASASEQDEKIAQARDHLEKAKIHYRLREFPQAVEQFREAYRIRPVAGILFNMAQAERMSGAYEDAKFHYQLYLQEVPGAPNEAEVREQIAQLTKLLDTKGTAGADSAATTAAPAAAPPLAEVDMARIVADSARLGAQQAAEAAAAVIERKLDEAQAADAARAKELELKAEKARADAEAARVAAEEKAEQARLDAERAAKEAEAARLKADATGEQAKADSDKAIAHALEAKRLVSEESERTRAEAERARAEAEKARLEAATARASAAEQEAKAKAEREELARRTDAGLAQNRQATEELREELRRAAAKPEPKRTGAFGLHGLSVFNDAALAADRKALGGAEPSLAFGLDGRIPIVWRLSVVLSLDWYRSGLSETPLAISKMATRYKTPVGAATAMAGIGCTIPIIGPLYVEGSVDGGKRMTEFAERRASEAGETGTHLSTAWANVWGPQLSLGLGFGSMYVAANVRHTRPIGKEIVPEPPAIGPKPSAAGWGALTSAGVLLGSSW